MSSRKILTVRILGLGHDGGRTVPAVTEAARGLGAGDGWLVRVESTIGSDDPRAAARTIRRWCDRDRVDVVFTVGRGGHEPGDFAPELTAALLDRPLPGIEERMYLASPRQPLDLLFRGRAGMRRATLVVNLPIREARARAIVRFLGPVVGHALEKARGDGRECARVEARA